ncbi:hypothetical protein ElyMa_005577200 [Elysia marginata]|uniref:Uncharacterized protein n=1 Tax=Elysia marginata TaxID=1093978 RepID=A0AAV4F392_9GAST|nr:hypothetical protein ElyMa_005577200 [Elysia marginata]
MPAPWAVNRLCGLAPGTHFTGGWTEECVDELLSEGNYNMSRGWEANPLPPDHESIAQTTDPLCSMFYT